MLFSGMPSSSLTEPANFQILGCSFFIFSSVLISLSAITDAEFSRLKVFW